MTTKVKPGVVAIAAIETAGIKDVNVTAGKLATNSVTTAKIADGAVTAAKLSSTATSLPIAYIGGLRLSNDTDTAHDINITAGAARDATNTADITLASEITKRIDASWAVGDDAGGLDGTESSAGTPDASTLYYVWLILRSDTSVVDALFSESATSPTMPTNYDYKRLIGMVRTDASANVIAFTQSGDYFRYTGAVVEDANGVSITNEVYQDVTLSVPPSCMAHVYGSIKDSGTTLGIMTLSIRTKGAADTIASGDIDHAWAGFEIGSGGADADEVGGIGAVLTDSSGVVQIAGLDTSSSATISVNTFGFWMLTRTDP